MSKKDISKVMKELRARRKDYSTAGFSNPEVQKKILEKRRQKSKNHLKDAEGFQKLEELE